MFAINIVTSAITLFLHQLQLQYTHCLMQLVLLNNARLSFQQTLGSQGAEPAQNNN